MSGSLDVRILLVEDNRLIAKGIVAGLARSAITTDHVHTSAQARAALDSVDFDAIVLDLGLPDQDGLALLKARRQAGDLTPVLVLSARGNTHDRIQGLEVGADDYMGKPFDLGELAARLYVLQRRQSGRAAQILMHEDLQLEPRSGWARLDGREVALSRRESHLLAALMQAKGRYLTLDQLKGELYGFDDEIASNTVNVHIHHLRRKLWKTVVVTVRGLGYRLGSRR